MVFLHRLKLKKVTFQSHFKRNCVLETSSKIAARLFTYNKRKICFCVQTFQQQNTVMRKVIKIC